MPINARKRKKPPAFQHLPVQRAKKLKKDWIEKKKIVKKWRHDKHKEGLEKNKSFPVQEPSHELAGVLETQGGHATERDMHVEDLPEEEITKLGSPSDDKLSKWHPAPHPPARGGISHSSRPRLKLKASSSEDQGRVQRNRGRRTDANSRGRAVPSRVRKQPDMQTKMGHLLEKIQKDYRSS